MDLALYHAHKCQICRESLITNHGTYRYYHPNCIIRARKSKPLSDFYYREEHSKIVYDDERDEL